MQPTFEKILTRSDASLSVRRFTGKSFQFNWHVHPEVELTLVPRSRGMRFVGDHMARYAEGDLCLLGANLPHTWASDSAPAGVESYVIQFRRDFLGDAWFDKPEMKHLGRLLTRAEQGLQILGRTRAMLAERIVALAARSGFAQVMGLLEILDHISHSREVRRLSSPGFRPSLAVVDHSRIDEVCRYLTAHLAEELTLPQAAGVIHMSPSAFCRFFRKATNKTFVEYLHELRIGKACDQLIHTDRTVAQIAFDVGFSNLANFNRRFRALKSTTPRDYRRRFRTLPATTGR